MLKKKNFALDALLAGILFLMVLVMLMLSSCKHEPDVLPKLITDTNQENVNNGGNGNGNQQSTCDPDTVYFQTQVLPLLISNCAKSGCHTAADHKDGVVLDNYSNVMSTGDIDPGRADHSKIYKVLIENDPDDRMPPSPATQLSNAQIDLIYKWINQGALNNTCTDMCDTTNVTFAGTIFPLIQNSCIGCHSGSAPGGLVNLGNYQNIAIVAQNGRLYGSVNHEQGFQPMPRGGNKLPDCKVNQIRIWIQNGALNN
jgi:Planctomycete cytochrome C